MKKTNEHARKFERKTHVISQLNGTDAPPDIKKFVYPTQEQNSK